MEIKSKFSTKEQVMLRDRLVTISEKKFDIHTKKWVYKVNDFTFFLEENLLKKVN